MSRNFKKAIRLEDPTTIKDPEVRSYLSQLLRTLKQSLEDVSTQAYNSSKLGENTVSSTSVAANYTLKSADYLVLCDTSGGSFTITLPDVTQYRDKHFCVKKVTSDANTVTLDCTGADEIDLAANFVLPGGYLDSATIYSDGSDWWII